MLYHMSVTYAIMEVGTIPDTARTGCIRAMARKPARPKTRNGNKVMAVFLMLGFEVQEATEIIQKDAFEDQEANADKKPSKKHIMHGCAPPKEGRLCRQAF